MFGKQRKRTKAHIKHTNSHNETDNLLKTTQNHTKHVQSLCETIGPVTTQWTEEAERKVRCGKVGRTDEGQLRTDDGRVVGKVWRADDGQRRTDGNGGR